MRGRTWIITISKTGAPGGAWLFEFHGGWNGGEDDAQAFTSLAHAKRYGRDGYDVRYEKVSETHWRGHVPEDDI